MGTEATSGLLTLTGGAVGGTWSGISGSSYSFSTLGKATLYISGNVTTINLTGQMAFGMQINGGGITAFAYSNVAQAQTVPLNFAINIGGAGAYSVLVAAQQQSGTGTIYSGYMTYVASR
jgi:hypothetical protein